MRVKYHLCHSFLFVRKMGYCKFLTVILLLFPLLQFSYLTKAQNGEYEVHVHRVKKEFPRVIT
jgi:hypothetical protein